MKLKDRDHVQGTENPSIYIGRRVKPDGAVSRRWSAVYYDGKRQVSKSLRTRFKHDAFRAAQDLHRALIRGDSVATPVVISVAELVKEYLDMLVARGRSHKTTTKYTRVLEDFAGVCEKGLQWKRAKSPKSSSGGTGSGP
jgi:hypothetical protein